MSHQNCSSASTIFASLVLGAAFLLSAYFIAQGLINFRSFDRTVNVKGLAMQDVEADLVLWPLRHAATGNDLPAMQEQIEVNTEKVIAFLSSQGLTAKDITSRKTEVTDLLAQSYRQNNVGEYRYIVAETVMVRTSKIADIEKAAQNIGDLLKQGISLSQENGAGRPQYIFTKLNDIKPAMIAQATKNARESARQFAEDSGTNVGQIKTAHQGVFQILPRDSDNNYQEREERYKTIRVVSTLEFYLE